MTISFLHLKQYFGLTKKRKKKENKGDVKDLRGRQYETLKLRGREEQGTHTKNPRRHIIFPASMNTVFFLLLTSRQM